MNFDVIIVGAGMAGLTAARQLEQAHLKVAVIDKGRSVGGRLATRRIEQGIADHGAQFFTARTDAFKAQIAQWMQDDIVGVWGYGWSDGSLKRTAVDGHARYITRGGMNQLAHALKDELTTAHIAVDTLVRSISYGEGMWCAATAKEGVFCAPALIMTPPVPQSLELLKAIPLDAETRKELEYIQYAPCLCGLFVVDGEVDLPDPGAIQRHAESIYWIADNQRKGISPDERIITAHANETWSRQNYDAPEEEVLTAIQASITPYLAPSATIRTAQLKKWRYSLPINTYPHDTLIVDAMRLAFAGDAFGGRGRVEGAYMSGLAAANAILASR